MHQLNQVLMYRYNFFVGEESPALWNDGSFADHYDEADRGLEVGFVSQVPGLRFGVGQIGFKDLLGEVADFADELSEV
jgi:hypothetical protein